MRFFVLVNKESYSYCFQSSYEGYCDPCGAGYSEDVSAGSLTSFHLVVLLNFVMLPYQNLWVASSTLKHLKC